MAISLNEVVLENMHDHAIIISGGVNNDPDAGILIPPSAAWDVDGYTLADCPDWLLRKISPERLVEIDGVLPVGIDSVNTPEPRDNNGERVVQVVPKRVAVMCAAEGQHGFAYMKNPVNIGDGRTICDELIEAVPFGG